MKFIHMELVTTDGDIVSVEEEAAMLHILQCYNFKISNTWRALGATACLRELYIRTIISYANNVDIDPRISQIVLSLLVQEALQRNGIYKLWRLNNMIHTAARDHKTGVNLDRVIETWEDVPERYLDHSETGIDEHGNLYTREYIHLYKREGNDLICFNLSKHEADMGPTVLFKDGFTVMTELLAL